MRHADAEYDRSSSLYTRAKCWDVKEKRSNFLKGQYLSLNRRKTFLSDSTSRMGTLRLESVRAAKVELVGKQDPVGAWCATLMDVIPM